MRYLLVGGVFDGNGGRPSGYIGKLGDSLGKMVECCVINGGDYGDLTYLVGDSELCYDVVLWFVDIDNSEGKLLSSFIRNHPHVLVVQSKNNMGRKYSSLDLRGRMVESGASLLVEFIRGEDQRVVGRVHRVGGDCILRECREVVSLAESIVGMVKGLYGLSMPICVVGEGWEVPRGNHKGSFGYVREHHVHEGVDIYCREGALVVAMEGGMVVGVGEFTGNCAGSPWWKETSYVMVSGLVGNICYGEIEPLVGDGEWVNRGDVIGRVVPVLREDKGNGVSMLHLEWYVREELQPVAGWKKGDVRPDGLLDPSILLECAMRGGRNELPYLLV